jgi:hypothetical protein
MDQDGERLKGKYARLGRNRFRGSSRVLYLAARAIVRRGRDRAIRAAAWGFNNRSRLRHLAAEAGMQREHERQQCENSPLHGDHANPLRRGGQ